MHTIFPTGSRLPAGTPTRDGMHRIALPGAPARSALVLYPYPLPSTPLPVIISPHPFGFTALQNLLGVSAGAQTLTDIAGWRGLAARFSVLIVAPDAEGRRLSGVSLAWPEQLAASIGSLECLEQAGFSIDRRRIYAAGLSMGGLESLALAAAYPERIAAVCSINGITDLVAWYRDIVQLPVLALRDGGIDALIVDEVGGTPEQCPDAFALRSPIQQVPALSALPLRLVWSELDSIVPRQRTVQSHALYEAIRRAYPDAPAQSVECSAVAPRAGYDAGHACHEFADFSAAAEWLLQHTLGGSGASGDG